MGAEENLEGFFEDPKTLIVYHRQQRFRKLKKKKILFLFSYVIIVFCSGLVSRAQKGSGS